MLSKAGPNIFPFLLKLSVAYPLVNSTYTPITSPVPVGSEYSDNYESGPNFKPPVHRKPQNLPTSGGRL